MGLSLSRLALRQERKVLNGPAVTPLESRRDDAVVRDQTPPVALRGQRRGGSYSVVLPSKCSLSASASLRV